MDEPQELWLVYGPYEGEVYYETEADAVAAAAGMIDGYLYDGSWDEDVERIAVARQTHHVGRRVLGAKADMTPSDWEDLTGGRGADVDEWWDYQLSPTIDHVRSRTLDEVLAHLGSTEQQLIDLPEDDQPVAPTPGQQAVLLDAIVDRWVATNGHVDGAADVMHDHLGDLSPYTAGAISSDPTALVRLAEALNAAGLLVTPAQRAVLDAADALVGYWLDSGRDLSRRESDLLEQAVEQLHEQGGSQ